MNKSRYDFKYVILLKGKAAIAAFFNSFFRIEWKDEVKEKASTIVDMQKDWNLIDLFQKN